MKLLELHYRMEPASTVRSWWGTTYVLSATRRISLWRKIRHKLGWSEWDTLIWHERKANL